SIGILLLNMDCALYIDIKQRKFLHPPNSIQLRFERTIIFSLVHHFPFHEFIMLNLVPEVFKGKKVIILAISLIAPWLPCCSRNRESVIRKGFEQVSRDRSLPCAGRSRDDEDLVCMWHGQN